jgi:hypothetical protein
MNIYLDTDKGWGFGDLLCLISLLCDIPEQVVLHTNNKENYYDRITELTRILCIPESKLKVVQIEINGDFAGAFHLKTVSDYYYPNHVLVNGEKISVNDLSRKKQYVGMALYNGLDGYVEHNNNFIRNAPNGALINEGNNCSRIPQCKFRSIQTYGQVFMNLRKWGYDVITLDGVNNIESKIKFLVENCRAVVGYEGGIAHLCHMLRIPYIMYDYRPSPDVDDCYGEYTAEVIHQSNTVHIMDNDELWFNKLNKNTFSELVDNLQNKRTNNRIVNGDIKMIFEGAVNSKVAFADKNNVITFQSRFGPQVSDAAVDLIHKFYRHKFPNFESNDLTK